MSIQRPSACGAAFAVVLGLLALPASISRVHAARTEIDLGGTWQFQKVAQLTFPPSNNWKTVTVPGFLSGWQYEHAWFRRVFTVPSSMAGTQIKLRFGGVKFNSQVWLNGVYLGTYLNGYEPFELDITAAALVGQTNELIVGVTDWTATFAAPVDFSSLPSGQNPRNFVNNTILAPIGGRYELYGIWQPVKVVSTPTVSIADVFVMPSVRAQELTVRLTLRNDAATSQTVTVANRVLDGASTALALPAQPVTVPGGTNVQVGITASWTNAHCWTHVDPYLYSLETTLTGGAGQDQVRTRFGFREFWTSNGQFYLNGTPIHLLATATWPPTDLQDSNHIRQALLDVKAGNNVAIRFHTQPWDEPWYDMADELGLLVVEECAVWCDPAAYKLSDPVFWTNYARHLSAAVKRDRNHPSIVLWSLENEILHCGGEKLYSGTEAELAEMGRVVKGMDPTRPITYEADLNPGGEANALGLHYPHEYPDYRIWPNTAYWMDHPIARDWVAGGQWLWDRAKPLYIGEFLWVPSTSAADFTILFGDDVYSDPTYYRNLVKGLTWRMQIEAYRSYGVNAMGPWTMFEDPSVVWGEFDLHPDSNYLYQVQKAAYDPNAVFVKEYNTRFFTGEVVTRTIDVYNDRLVPGDFTLRWSSGGAWQSRSFSLPPAGHRQDSISFGVPLASGPFPLQLELSGTNGVGFTNSIACSAAPRSALSLAVGAKLALYDPQSTTAGLLQRFGLPFATVTNLRTADYSQFSLLVIGRDALTNSLLPEVGSDTIGGKWQSFAANGGWVLVLEQTNYPAWMPGGLQIQDFDASFAFPDPDHAVTAGLTPNDLRWWADDHRVVLKAITSPSRGNARVLAQVGSTQGLEYAAAVELPCGTGGILCSQWLVSRRFDLEPMAALLLQRLLNYCSPGASHPVLHPMALLAEPNSPVAAKIATLGFLAENVSGRLTNCDPAVYPVLLVGGGNTAWQEATLQLSALTNFVERGGKLVLHRPTAGFLAAAQPVLFPELDFADATLGLVLRRDKTNAVVRLWNHDLYWIGQPGRWDQPEALSTNVASRYYRKHFNLPAYNTIKAENMPIHTAGSAGSGGWWLWSNGYMAQDITATQAGTYLFNVSASGTPALGGWPQMMLKIDGRMQDLATVPTNQAAWYTLSANLKPGTHQLAIDYENDTWAPPEDRNLFVDRIRWGLDNDSSPTTLLTAPGAVAQVRRGSGVILLDEIAWDTEAGNATKAERFASTLLTGLGAAAQLPLSLGIEAETMTNVNVAAYQVSGGIANLYSNGRIETAVNFTTTGDYSFEVVAGGTPVLGVLPLIGIVIDGVTRTNFFLTSTAMTHYTVTLSIIAGTHAVGLAFLNDAYAPPEDRNAAFDRLIIAPVDHNAFIESASSHLEAARRATLDQINICPRANGCPVRNSPALIRRAPSRCTLQRRSAPEPQPTRMPLLSAHNTWPGSPGWTATSAAQIFNSCGRGPAGRNVKAPGQGTIARTRFQMASADCFQSICPSCFRIFGA
jgi:hypothetical protein